MVIFLIFKTTSKVIKVLGEIRNTFIFEIELPEILLGYLKPDHFIPINTMIGKKIFFLKI